MPSFFVGIGRVDILLDERKVPQVNIQRMKEYYSNFGLSSPYDPNNTTSVPAWGPGDEPKGQGKEWNNFIDRLGHLWEVFEKEKQRQGGGEKKNNEEYDLTNGNVGKTLQRNR